MPDLEEVAQVVQETRTEPNPDGGATTTQTETVLSAPPDPPQEPTWDERQEARISELSSQTASLMEMVSDIRAKLLSEETEPEGEAEVVDEPLPLKPKRRSFKR